MFVEALVIFIADSFNLFDLFDIRKRSIFLSVFNNVGGGILTYIRKAYKLFKRCGIDINLIIYSFAINKIDDIRERRMLLKCVLQQRTKEDDQNK